jgi:hydroxymethylglutaryl-CoA synthase
MIGILGIGASIPRYRLSGETLAQVWGGGGGGERALANYDEDSLTMAADAALNALAGRDPSAVGACLFASTTPPYLEKSNATLLAAVADLGTEVVTADLVGSLRAGTTALRLALDLVRAGTASQALAAAADMRPVPPGSDLETLLGDGAAAVLVGQGEVLATFEGAFLSSREFTDVWRKAEDRYLQVGDPTFARTQGLDRHIPEAVDGLLGRLGVKREEIARVALYAPDFRTHAALARQLKFPEAAVGKEPLINRVGNTGTASPLLGLAAALEEARPGDRILVVSYGSGAEALLFQATERVERLSRERGVAAQLALGRPLAHYGKLLRFRRHVETEVIRAFSSLPTLAREERQDLRLYGQKCRECGAVSYPRRHLCWKCSSADLAEHKLSRRGKVFTFTKDHLVPNPDPPTLMVAADLEGGGRFYAQLTDCDPGAVAIDMPVELTFRRLHEGEELVNYFWKFRPAS